MLSTAELELILSEVEKRSLQLQHDGQRLVATARQWMVFGPPAPRKTPMQAMLDWIEAQLKTIGSTIADFWSQWGAPPTLWSRGREWSESVGGRISAQVGKATLDEIHVDDFWTGRAAEAYKTAVGRQKDALSAIAGIARDLDGILSDVAYAIIGYWIALLAILVELVLVISTSAAASAIGVGAPAGVAATVVAIAKFAAAFVAIIAALYAVLNGFVPKIRELRQIRHNNAFPGGEWPRPGQAVAITTSPKDDWQLK